MRILVELKDSLVVGKIKRGGELLESIIITVQCSDEEPRGLNEVKECSRDQRWRTNFCSITASPFLSSLLEINTGCHTRQTSR